ncbi:hypothetical protein [Clostridium tagluense]|nr:hypothetical protein [Clostridium tagluense]MCB2313260.1 hypothetical protein [Clostridium tagluense]MCB2317989.1 hypothetical protein [Clostridium tagluense]MCB2327773.1 hypothetical protein [Clostridium tagluense]MCB2332420.1 hypothetical protein [Clostridium tagluense]WAG53420.1 hypothetical protein LL095_25510 [Clostridium tagluense]
MGILMGAYELNKVKMDIPEVAEALQFDKDMEIYKSKIESLKAENQGLNIDKEAMETTLQGAFNISDELKKQVKQLSEITDSNKALIQEYKEKNDTLTGLVTEYKGFKNENETIKCLLADSQARNINLSNKIISKDIEVDTLKTKLEAVAVEAQKEVKRTSELKEFEKEKALLQQEKAFNKKMQEQQEESNKKILEYQRQAEEFIREMQMPRQNQSKKTEIKR